jgi:hypothetical protein
MSFAQAKSVLFANFVDALRMLISRSSVLENKSF